MSDIKMRDCTLYLVLPCYNEEEVLPETSSRLEAKMNALMEAGSITRASHIVFVNDGSKDRTWSLIEDLHARNPLFRGICLSRNEGHQNALLAGLMTVKDECDAAISMDADLQDDINAIDEMVEKYRNGTDVVYGVRSSRKTDTFFKRTTALGFYRVMSAMGVESVYNHADYRLMSRRALSGLAEFKEVNLFLRGMVPLVGYPSDTVTYERGERFAGESKYPLKKMLAFAWQGITSMSTKPIKLLCSVGALLAIPGFVLSVVALVLMFVHWNDASAVLATVRLLPALLLFFAGLGIFAVGVVGEYVGKIYLETKARPRFLIREYLKDEGDGK